MKVYILTACGSSSSLRYSTYSIMGVYSSQESASVASYRLYNSGKFPSEYWSFEITMYEVDKGL